MTTQRPVLPMCEELDLAIEAVHARVRTCAWKGRIALLSMLVDGPKDVSFLARAAGLELCAASRHLKALRSEGLVVCERDGKRRVYSFSSAVRVEVRPDHVSLTVQGNWGTGLSLLLPTTALHAQYSIKKNVLPTENGRQSGGRRTPVGAYA